jgi:hypothetical protein
MAPLAFIRGMAIEKGLEHRLFRAELVHQSALADPAFAIASSVRRLAPSRAIIVIAASSAVLRVRSDRLGLSIVTLAG